MIYEVWTAKDVEYRVLEAAETIMLSPNHYVSSSFWPAVVRSAEESYGYGSSWYKRRPSAGALDRMLETWGWINALPSESDRKLLYSWAWVKTRKSKFLNDFASREGINSKTLRRSITRICQQIATLINQKHVAWVNSRVDAVSEIAAEPIPQTVSSENRATPDPTTGVYGAMAPGAKPRYPTPEEIASLAKRLEKQNRRRKAGR